MRNTRIAYVQPDFIGHHDIGEWEEMTYEQIANEEGVEIYTPYGFQFAFNGEIISDQGLIFFYELKKED